MNKKLYAIKNDEGEWADKRYIFGYGAWVTPDKNMCEEYVKYHGGHVVTLIEEPEKVVLTKEQAGIVEHAHKVIWPAKYITQNIFSYDEEKLIMKAYVNGYTMAKEKRYIVKAPHTDDSYFYKVDDDFCNAGDSFSVNFGDDTSWFTEDEIQHYGLQDCERVEINTEDSNGN